MIRGRWAYRCSESGSAGLVELAGRDLSDRWRLFMRETGEDLLRPYFADVHRIDLESTPGLTAEDMRNYVAHSVAHKHLSEQIPDFEGARVVTASSAVFVATV
jgi:hypothetical protein